MQCEPEFSVSREAILRSLAVEGMSVASCILITICFVSCPMFDVATETFEDLTRY
jgi:hypothetical protein